MIQVLADAKSQAAKIIPADLKGLILLFSVGEMAASRDE